MPSEGSVTYWIDRLRAGDRAAAQPLWERYFGELVRLTRRRLRGQARRVADEEDVVLSAFDTFCRRAAEGRFPRLEDRDGLWRLLLVITAHKAAHLVRDQRRLKRGGEPRPDSPLPGLEPDLGEVLAREPTPEFAAQAAEECRRLLDRLGDDELGAVALWKMEGHTTEEIADRLGYVPRTVERKLRLIRTLWAEEVGS
jgi:DNA-directed RNA polymerase specialized sigma24 family protein